MKPITSFALLCAFAAVAQGAVSDPVGYITHTIYGTESSGASSTLTVISPTLVQPTAFAAQTSANPSGLSTIAFSGGVPALDSSYVLEIPATGWWSTVISSTSTSITLNDALPTGLANNTPITVRKHNTIKSLFGANAPGLAPFDGTSGDEIQILTPAQAIIAIVYVPAALGVPADGWYNLVTTVNEDNTIIEPGSAVLVKTASATDLDFVSTGTVKTTPTQVDVFPNLTLVGQVDAVGATLGEMNFSTQLFQLADPQTVPFDELQVLRPNQGIDAYVALSPGFGGPAMANLVTTANADTLAISEGTGVIIKRDPSNSASVVTLPGSTVTE